MTIHKYTAAAVDLGSNTFRLLVAKWCEDGMEVQAKHLATVGLGRGLNDGGRLADDSMQKGSAVLGAFRDILAHYRPESMRVCGTEALRRAANSREFLERAEALLDCAVDILDGEEEARLSLAGALSGLQEPASWPLLLVDVGGGSTELIYADSPEDTPDVQSVPLGVVGLTEQFIDGSQAELARLDNFLTEMLQNVCAKLEVPGLEPSLCIIGCGGTATSMAALDQKLTDYNESLVHGHVLFNIAIKELWDNLILLPPNRRNGLPCLGAGRGEILPAGIRIFHILLQLLEQDKIQVSDTGLLEGILLSSLPGAAV